MCFYLLIALEVGVVAFLICAGALLKHERESAGTPNLRMLTITECVAASIYQCCISTVHWVFAMKYWANARKL
jgi:hypothetical protein